MERTTREAVGLVLLGGCASAFPLLLAAVLVSAWYGGLGPGLLATALGASTGPIFSLAAVYSLGSSPSEVLPLSAFLLEALLICGITVVLRLPSAGQRHSP